MARLKKIQIDTLFTIFTFAITIFGGIITVPITFSKLGDTNYGMWVFINTLASYSSIFFLGFGVTIITYVAEYCLKKNSDRLQKALGTLWVCYIAVGTCIFMTSILIAFLLPFVIKLPANHFEYQFATVVLGLQIALSFPFSIYQSILSGLERYVVRDAITTFGSILSYIGVFVVPYEYATITFFACLSFSTNLLMGLLNYVSSRIFLPEILVTSKYYSKSVLPSLFKISIYSFVINTARKIINLTDTIIIGIVLGPVAVALYSVPQKMMFYLQQLLWKAQSIVFPKFVKLNLQQDDKNTAHFYFFCFRYSLVLTAPISVIYFIYGSIFQVMWMGEQFAAVHIVLIVLMLSAFFSQPIINSFLNSSLLRRKAAQVNTIQALLNLILSCIFIHIWGLVGVAIATSISNFLVGFLLLNLVAIRSLKKTYLNFIQEVLSPIIFAYIACFFCIYMCFTYGWGRELPGFLGVCTLAEIVFIVFYLPFDENIKKLIKNIGK